MPAHPSPSLSVKRRDVARGCDEISTLSDISTRYLRQKQPTEKKLADCKTVSFSLFLLCCSAPHKSMSARIKPVGQLAQCLLLYMKQLITAEGSGGVRFLPNAFAILQSALPSPNLFYISGVLRGNPNCTRRSLQKEQSC
jgi:hypothetical protein